MAGSLGMQVKKFIIVDLISGIFWACIYLLPGYFAGKAVTNETNVVAMILSAIAAVVAVYLASRYRMLKKNLDLKEIT